MSPRVLPIFLGLLLLTTPLAALAQTGASGTRVSFDAVKFDDTLFASIDGAYRVQFDENGDLWYTTGAGLVHVDVDNKTRKLYSPTEGLPSSVTLGLAVTREKVYVTTDLGLAVLDRATDKVTAILPQEGKLPDSYLEDVAVIDGKVWIATHFFGLAIWDPKDDSWAVKNTSTKPGYANPIKRISVEPQAVWLATQGDGVHRYDPTAGAPTDDKAWRVLLKEDGLPSDKVYSVAERGSNVYFGTDKGLARWAGLNSAAAPSNEWLYYNKTGGMPSDLVNDIDIVPTVDGDFDVFAATPKGLWQLRPTTGESTTRAQDFGILGTIIHDTVYGTHGWVFATNRGVSLRNAEAWNYYTTGPSAGASPGPQAFFFTAAGTGDSPYLWFGSSTGVSAFDPHGREGKGAWYNIGEWNYYPGSVVNHIDTLGNMTWIATNKGTYGFNVETGEWTPKLARSPSRNLVYGLDADDNELWIALFGEGLLMQNLKTGTTRSWDALSVTPLPDLALTDVRVQGKDVWIGASIGLIRMDRVAGTITATYGSGDGLPGNGIVFRTLPDGANVWVGMQDGGVAQLSAASGKVTKVWNWSKDPGFPTGEVRSLHREGGRLWVGFGCSNAWRHETPCTGGLARIDLATGTWKAYTQQDTDLAQNFVNGITSAEGVLYAATGSGVSRFDIIADKFLPMQSGSGALGDGTTNGTTNGPRSSVLVRIDTPRDGRAVTGVTTISGTASRFGGTIDLVELKIGAGEWTPVTGTDTWTHNWDTAGLDGQVAISARATSGNQTSRVSEIIVTVVKAPDVPLTIEHKPADSWRAGKAYPLRAVATGDDPLSVAAYYQKPGQADYTRIVLLRQGSQFTGQIPARDVKEGELTYYLDARSGLLSATSPEDATRPHRIDIGPAPRLSIGIEAPSDLGVQAGTTLQFDLTLTNTGTQPADVLVQARGLRSSWVRIDTAPIPLAPGANRTVQVSVDVPVKAIADVTEFTFEVSETTGEAEPASATVKATITPAAKVAGDAQPTQKARWFGIPGPGALLALAGIAGAALALRRRT